MTNTEFPADQGESRDYIALERKVADLANALASGGSRFITGDLIPHWGPTREGAVLCDGTIYLDTDPLIGDALATLLRSQGFFTDGTHVQVPDYRGQALGGVGGSLGALGVPAGVATVTLTAAQSGLPGHFHTMAATTGGPSVASTGVGTAHSHVPPSGTAFITGGIATFTLTPGAGFNVGSGATTGNESAHTHSMQAHTHTLPDTDAVAAAAAVSSHTNIQPTLPAYIFIKT